MLVNRGGVMNLNGACDVAFSNHNSMKFTLRPAALTAFLVATTVALLSNSSGVAHQQNKDRTGAPGSDNTCQQCHAGGSYAPTVQAFLVVDGAIEVPNYIPGAVHSLMVQVNSTGSPAGYGVQGTVLLADNSNAGELVDQDSGDCIWLDEVDGRHIFEQNDLCSSGMFEVEWVAPPAGSGPVTVYVATVTANGNSTSSGDVFEGAQFQFNEGVVGVAEADVDPVRISHNADGELDLILEGPTDCAVFGMDGRILFDGALPTGRHSLAVGQSGWIVVRCVTSNGRTFTQRIWTNA